MQGGPNINYAVVRPTAACCCPWYSWCPAYARLVANRPGAVGVFALFALGLGRRRATHGGVSGRSERTTRDGGASGGWWRLAREGGARGHDYYYFGYFELEN